MIDIKRRWKSVADRRRWAARGASFVAKTKATRAVWFPPKPADTGTKAASTAKKTSKRTAKKTTGSAKKSATAAKKTAGGRKKVSTR